MEDLLQIYDDMVVKQDLVTIRRKQVHNNEYYFEFIDVTYLKVAINKGERIYHCDVLNPDSGFRDSMYAFNLSFDYVIEVGNFEDALTQMYNQVVKPILTNMKTIDIREDIKEQDNGST